MDSNDIKITFGMIVFNAESILPENMLSLCVENVYPFAHEIIIVEGATKAINHYWDGNTDSFTLDGKSTDNTIDVIKGFPDPLKKIQLIESRGFWNGKTEMCNKYASLATGNYIWQLDSDEFWKHKDIHKIIDLLKKESPDAIHFMMNHFFGDFKHCIDERQDNKWGNSEPLKRIFKHIPGKSYWFRHEPPEYVCDGKLCNNGKVINKYETLKMGIKMQHYSYVSRTQAEFKDKFFGETNNLKEWIAFQTDKSTTAHGSIVYPFTEEYPDIIKNYYNL
jgi:hypothetical protein